MIPNVITMNFFFDKTFTGQLCEIEMQNYTKKGYLHFKNQGPN